VPGAVLARMPRLSRAASCTSSRRWELSCATRAVLLWVGSVTSPILHAIILIAVFKSLATGVPALTLALVYLVASAVSALVPSPGGFGALDVALVAGMVAVGAPSATAVAVVLGYRLVTVWAPLVPGALVFAFLLRRQLIYTAALLYVGRCASAERESRGVPGGRRCCVRGVPTMWEKAASSMAWSSAVRRPSCWR